MINVLSESGIDSNLQSFSRDVKGDASEQAILKCMEQVDGNVAEYRKEFPTACEIPFNSTNKYQVNSNH